jgi:hypothetical protein
VKAFHLLFMFISLSVLGTTVAAQSSGPSTGGSSGALGWLTAGDFKPYLEAGYGVGLADQKLFTGDFPHFGIAELRLGYREMKPYKSWGYKLDDRALFGSYGTTDMTFGEPGSAGGGAKLWKAGVGRREGFGYQIAFMKLILDHAYSFNFTGLTANSYAGLSGADSAIVARYSGHSSFSLSTEPGLTAEMFGFLRVTGGLDVAVVYPRVVFPQWITTYLLASSSIALISSFSEDIVNVSPVLGPLLYFILRNGVAMAWAYAWSSDMNWPFPSETPVMLKTLRLTAGIQF